jgi:predicted ATP-grasp superfamily ATP-dependent carboligase
MKTMVARCTRNSGLAIIRALASAGHDVIGIDDRPMPFGLYTRHASKCEHYDALTEDEEIEAILGLVRLHRPDVLIATPLTKLLVPRAGVFAAHTNCLLPTPQAYESITDKLRLVELCVQLGIPAPGLLSEQQAKERLLDHSLSQAQRTVVIKPRRDIGGGQGVHIIRDAEQISPAISDVNKKYGPAFISEFVPGPREDIVAVNLLFDRDSQLVGQFASRKLRLFPPETGVTALGQSIFAPELVQRLLPLFEAVEWQGPADAEFKIDAESGEARLLEINGRFTGALAFSIDCGVNFPALYCDAVIGAARPCGLKPSYSEGVVYWNPGLLLKSLLHDWQSSGEGCSRVRRVIRLAKGRKVGSPWRLSDPAPFFGKLMIEMRESIRTMRNRGNAGNSV